MSQSPSDSSAVWSGVYASFSEVSGRPASFDSDDWSAALAPRVAVWEEGLLPVSSVPKGARTQDNQLAVLIATLRKPTVRVLDFGGGFGRAFFLVRASIPRPVAIDFHIVETAHVCRSGRKWLGHRPEIRFHESIAAAAESAPFDIVHSASALQYVEDWRGCVAALLACKPSHALFVNVPMGDVPSFVTTQRIRGERVPVWFLNHTEFVDHVEACGYRLAYQAHYVVPQAGSKPNPAIEGWASDPLPMGALPPTHRIPYTQSTLFLAV